MHAHAAVLEALIDSGVPPSAVAGTSAGAVIACLHAAGMTPLQMAHLIADPPHIVRVARPWHEFGGLLSSAYVVEALERVVRRYGLAERLEQCGLPVAVSAFVPASLATRVLSEQEGGSTRLAQAIVAALAIPGLFSPVRLPGVGLCIDGGIGDFPGISGVRGSQRVLYHHASALPLAWIDRLYIGRQRRNRRSLSLGGLPFLHPLSLARVGGKCFAAAREAMERALRSPAGADGAHVHVRARTWPLGLWG